MSEAQGPVAKPARLAHVALSELSVGRAPRRHRRPAGAAPLARLEPLEPRVLLSGAGEIQGVAWNDLNGDGVRSAGEPVLPGWTVFLDSNDNGLRDVAEPATLTDALGAYSFTNLPAGTYVVSEVPPAGWMSVSVDPARLASVGLGGAAANNQSWYSSTSISADGRYVAFSSYASNLVPGDTNGNWDIFVYDRQTGSVERESVAAGGAQANGDSYCPSISADGRYVAFESGASNLVSGDTNAAGDIFVRDRQTGLIERVSVSSSGVQASAYSYYTAISADGRFVAFQSSASNLVSGDSNGVPDVFVRDRQGGITQRVSVGSDGSQANNRSFVPSLSADGRYVAFDSWATNLVSGDTNGVADAFVYDRTTGQMRRVSVSSSGDQANDASSIPSLSADGRFVTYYSAASNLVPGDTNATGDIFVTDLQSGAVQRVSVSSLATQANGNSYGPALSADGRYVSFQSDASNLVSGDGNGRSDVFVYDRQTGLTRRVSMATDGGATDGDSYYPAAISGDGRYVAFSSAGTNLVAGDTNGFTDTFVSAVGGNRVVTVNGDVHTADFANQLLPPSAAPSAPDLLSASDSGVSTTDNITNHDNSAPILPNQLQFTVDGTVAGATVSIYADGHLIGSATASGTTTTVLTSGTYDLADGTVSITARQIEPGKSESADSSVLSIAIDTVATTSAVAALSPTQANTAFTVSWFGADAGGSGLAGYDVYVSDNGGAYAAWLSGTSGVSAVFTGQRTHSYAFYSRAHDIAGNVESAPAVPDATTSVEAASVAGRKVFYNNSGLDGNDTSVNAADDNAIDTSKQALLPGQPVTTANVTGYSSGINGIMVDITGLANPGGLTLANIGNYFSFQVLTITSPSAWAAAPAPTAVAVRPGQGAGGSDRVTVIWSDGANVRRWLRATVKAGAGWTGLAADDVFTFGNLTGDANGDGVVDVVDLGILAMNYDKTGRSISRGDFNADGVVDVIDLGILAMNYDRALPPVDGGGSAGAAGQPLALSLTGQAGQEVVGPAEQTLAGAQNGSLQPLSAVSIAQAASGIAQASPVSVAVAPIQLQPLDLLAIAAAQSDVAAVQPVLAERAAARPAVTSGDELNLLSLDSLGL